MTAYYFDEIPDLFIPKYMNSGNSDLGYLGPV